MSAAQDVVFQMQIEAQTYDSLDWHYHVTDGTELTIIGSLDDLERYLQAEVDERCEPLVDGITVTAFDDHGFSCIGIDHPETEYTTIRTRECIDPTCKIALIDFYL
jgi:hypothetical protein